MLTITLVSIQMRTTNESEIVDRLKEELFSVIEKTMEKENVTQAEMARRIGAQRYNINKVMRGKFAVTLDFLIRMAEALGLEVKLSTKKSKD